MHPEPACSPFELAASLVAEARRQAAVVLVDFHAEATSEKVAMGRHLAGRVTAVLGTHTHVQTNDASLWDGTAYLTDCGMTGPHDSVIGVRTEIALRRFLTQLPARSEPALGDVRLEGALVEWTPKADGPRESRRSGGRREGTGGRHAGRARVPSRDRARYGPATASQERDVAVIVHVRPSAELPRAARPGELALLLQARARRDQSGLMRLLRAAVEPRRGSMRVQSLWIDDSIALRARPALVAQLRRRADVLAIEPDRPLRIAPAAAAVTAAGAPFVPVTATGAPTLWAQGQTGRNVVVAVLDTGLMPGFPQLATSPGSWFDPYEQHATPFDEDSRGHGTEVAEIVTSMAPDIRIIAARVFSDGGRSTTSAVHRVFEWVLDPDGNPKTDDAPSVINGSWDDGEPGRCEKEFDSDIAALRAAGIVPVFAAGNAGPAASSARARHRRRAPSPSAA